MLTRRSFLKGSLAAVAVAALNPRALFSPVPAEAPMELEPLLAFPEGSFLYLDSGTLELGIVRDSLLLTAPNDYQVFTESFDGLTSVLPAFSADRRGVEYSRA